MKIIKNQLNGSLLREQNMKLSDLILRCYAKKEPDNSWYAICIDLNLLVQADTLEEAKEKLNNVIAEYLDEAFTVDKQYFSDLVPRKAPLYFILTYYWTVILSKFTNLQKSMAFKDLMPLKVDFEKSHKPRYCH